MKVELAIVPSDMDSETEMKIVEIDEEDRKARRIKVGMMQELLTGRTRPVQANHGLSV